MDAAGRIWIAGAGGIGSVVGYRLARAGLDPLVVDGWDDNVRAINDAGLRLAGQFGDVPVAARAIAFDDACREPEPPDIVLLCAKSFQTGPVLDALASKLAPPAIVVSLQNGMNEEAIAARVGAERTVGAVVVMDAALAGPGVATQENPDERSFTLGSLDGGPSAAVETAASVLRVVGDVRVSDDILGELWAKLVHNCMINGVCALTGLTGAQALRHPRAWPFIRTLGREAVAVSRAEGVTLGAAGLFGCKAPDFLEDGRAARLEEAILAAYPETEELYPSMAQDVAKGRPTEIRWLNGWIEETGRKAGVATPGNSHITALIGAVERGVLKGGEQNVELLDEAPAADIPTEGG